jgi:hypothetical protein
VSMSLTSLNFCCKISFFCSAMRSSFSCFNQSAEAACLVRSQGRLQG